MLKIALFFSGNGSNARCIVKNSLLAESNYEVVCAVTDNAQARGIQYMREANIPFHCVQYGGKKSVAEHSIIDYLSQFAVDIICLAGFMRLLSGNFITALQDKIIINIHPSLLPLFKGLNAVQQALQTKVRFTGCTVHLVTPEMDSGAIIAQSVVTIDYNDNEDTLLNKIHTAEHELYSKVITAIANQDITIDDGQPVFTCQAQNNNIISSL